MSPGNLYEQYYPTLLTAYEGLTALWTSLAPYHPEVLLPSFLGCILCFFGGEFVLTIAAVEAYRACGWETTYKCLVDLKKDFDAVVEASKKDDAVDADGNGVPDVNEIPPKELLKRKIAVFLANVDPKRFTDALSGINAGFVAVVATLKLEFVMALTLGYAIADAILPPLHRIFEPILTSLPGVKPEYRRWIPVVITYSVRYACVSLAFFLQRVISAFHSSIRGGLMIARNVLIYLKIMKFIHIDDKDSIIDEAIGYGLAALGFWLQLSNSFRLPFPLNLILFPFTLIEWFLTWSVSK